MKNTRQFNELVNVLLNIKSKEQMIDFLYGILTPKEIDQLSTRLQIVKMLKKGVSQQKVAQKLGVGIATVERGAREIKVYHRFQNI